MQSTQELIDVIEDNEKNLNNILEFGNDGDDQVSISNESSYYTETEYSDLLQLEKNF